MCDPGQHLCVECVATTDCGAAQVCAGEVCRNTCVSDKDCTGLGLLCDKVNGRCAECLVDGDCQGDALCASGVCRSKAIGSGGTSGSGGGGVGGLGVGGVFGDGGPSGCQSDVLAATPLPLDMIVLLDQSGSMAEVVSAPRPDPHSRGRRPMPPHGPRNIPSGGW